MEKLKKLLEDEKMVRMSIKSPKVGDFCLIKEVEMCNGGSFLTHSEFVGTYDACKQQEQSYRGEGWDGAQSYPVVEWTVIPASLICGEYTRKQIKRMVCNGELRSPTDAIEGYSPFAPCTC